jgi:putative tricarboxylic transport membrane protein
MLRYGYPIAPAILGLILGPLLETHLRRSLAIGVGDPLVFLEHPIAMALFAATFLAIVGPLVIRIVRRRRTRAA